MQGYFRASLKASPNPWLANSFSASHAKKALTTALSLALFVAKRLYLHAALLD
jgi:hypothetical protein